MPLIGKRGDTGERIDLTQLEDPRQVLTSEAYACPLCEQPLVVKGKSLSALYFAHERPCSSGLLTHPETARHNQGKRFIRQRVRGGFGQYRQAEIAFEVPVPELRSVVDVLVTFPSGWRVAHTCQLAPATIEELAQRTAACLEAGMDVIWWLGEAARTPRTMRWCRTYFGFIVTLDFLAPGDPSQRQVSTSYRSSAQIRAKAISHNEVYERVEYFLSFYLADREVQRALEIWKTLSDPQLTHVLGRPADAPAATIGITARDLREAKTLTEESDIPMETVTHFLAKKALTAPLGTQSSLAELFEDTSMMTLQALVNAGIVWGDLHGDTPMWRLINRQALHSHRRAFPIRPFSAQAQQAALAIAAQRPGSNV